MTACGFERSEETQLPEQSSERRIRESEGFKSLLSSHCCIFLSSHSESRKQRSQSSLNPSYLRTAASSCLRIANPGSIARRARRVPPSPRKKRAREGGTSQGSSSLGAFNRNHENVLQPEVDFFPLDFIWISLFRACII